LPISLISQERWRSGKGKRKNGQQATREGKIKIRKKSGRRAELKTNMEKASSFSMILLRMKREALVLKKRCQFRIHQVVPQHVCKTLLKIAKVETPSSQKCFCSKGNLSVCLPV
jgi:hypothetical protein